MSTIKAGYRITVRSWENDADVSKTTTNEGYTFGQMQFICEALARMRSVSRSKYSNQYFGNMCDPDDEEITAFAKFYREVYEKYAEYAKELEIEPPTGDDEEDAESLREFVSVFTDFSEDYYTRVVAGVHVEYVPVDIVMEDVSNQFATFDSFFTLAEK